MNASRRHAGPTRRRVSDGPSSDQSLTPSAALRVLREAFQKEGDADRAADMARYMRGQFVFFGLGAADRRALARSALAGRRLHTGEEVLELAELAWAEPERELQYAAVDQLARRVAELPAGSLGRIRNLVASKSWWDTVDALASHVVGTMVAAHGLGEELDHWIADEDIWIARTAILHQLRYRDATDTERLFAYCSARAGDDEFFIRKAIGWALRQYARTDPAAVRRFVDDNRDRLSPLSVREATKHL